MTETMSVQEYLQYQNTPSPKPTERVLRGKATQSRGKSFEADINAANDAYERLGMARIEQLPVATQPMPKTWLAREHQPKSGIARILAERAPFDYYGTLGAIGTRPPSNRGRAIAMECKATEKHATRLAIGKKATLKEHQLKACAESWQRFGTITCIVWRNGDQRGVLTPDRIVDAWQKYRIGSRKSIPWDSFLPYPIKRLEDAGLLEHWLEPVVAFINHNLR